MRSKTVKKYKATTNSMHNLLVAENLLNRDFSANRPNEKWVSDITYIATDEGWLGFLIYAVEKSSAGRWESG